MNCNAAQRLISAERDAALGGDARTTLEAHLADCAACREWRGVLADSAEAWREATAAVRSPDPQMAWQRISRQLKVTKDGGPLKSGRSVAWLWGASLATAAALTLVTIGPGWFRTGPAADAAAGERKVARAEFVEVGGKASSAMVFVDEKSGWLVVWAAGAVEKAGDEKS